MSLSVWGLRENAALKAGVLERSMHPEAKREYRGNPDLKKSGFPPSPSFQDLFQKSISVFGGP
jgi:hypothetical protein